MELKSEHLTRNFRNHAAVNDVSFTLGTGVHALLGEIEEQIIARIEEQLVQTPSLQTLNALVNFLKHVRQSPREIRLLYTLVGEQGDPHFVRRLQKLTYDAFRRGWAHRMPAASESHKRLTFSFIVPGVISVLSAWVHGDMPDIPAEEVVALLESIIENGVNGVYEHISGK